MMKNSNRGEFFMPLQGSEFAESFDRLYQFVLFSSLLACFLVIGGMFYFAIKYRRRSDQDKTPHITHNTFLEFLWSFVPFVIFMVVFAWGWVVYHDMNKAPSHAIEIHVVGQKWSWNFLYKSGRRTSGEFYVPINTPIKLIMTSADVVHSFSIPVFRIKQDVLPHRYTSLWFEAIQKGSFHVFCTEFCGEGHSSMLAKVHVLPLEKYEEWLENDPNRGLSLFQLGEKAFETKCKVCHSVDGKSLVGPTFKGLWNQKRVFDDGLESLVDEAYLRESILDPGAKIVKGFPPGAMPSFQGQVSEDEIRGIIEFIKSVK